MAETVFSKILSGEIPSFKVYEDDFVYAFLDISQVTKGHTLLIPKKRHQIFLKLMKRQWLILVQILPKVANAIKKAFNPDGLNIIQNNGEFADQSVFHIHFHFLPRYENDIDGFDTIGKHMRTKLMMNKNKLSPIKSKRNLINSAY